MGSKRMSSVTTIILADLPSHKKKDNGAEAGYLPKETQPYQYMPL